jgi:hypothetical protein
MFFGYNSLHKGYTACMFHKTVSISLAMFFDENVFAFANFSSTHTHTPNEFSPISIEQFVDAAYGLALLFKCGARTGRGTRLELLDEDEAFNINHILHVDRSSLHGHAHAPNSSFVPIRHPIYSHTWATSGPLLPVPWLARLSCSWATYASSWAALTFDWFADSATSTPCYSESYWRSSTKKIWTDGTVAWHAARKHHGIADPSTKPNNHHDALCIPHWRASME